MSELSDVTGGQIIGAGFTNQVKERTVMRYVSAATRDTSIPIPVEGSLAYLLDVNRVTVYNGAYWEDMKSEGIYLPLSGGTLTGDVDHGGNAITNVETVYDTIIDATSKVYSSLTSGIVTLDVQAQCVETTIITLPAVIRPSQGAIRWISPTFTSGFGPKDDVATMRILANGELQLQHRGPNNVNTDWAISTFSYVQYARGI